MNISYFRETSKRASEAAEAFKEGLARRGIVLARETPLEGGGVLLQFFDAKRAERILAADRTLVGLVPDAALIARQGGATFVGIGNPELLAGSPHAGRLEGLVGEMNRDLRALVNEAAGVGDPKVRSVTLYSTTQCPYCKMEKAYLEARKVPFVLKMVDSDQDAAEEMVRKSGQMGVPVTEVAFDDGESEVFVGFDKGRLNQLLNLS